MKTLLTRSLAWMLALAFIAAPAIADTYSVQALDYCAACDRGSFAFNFEGDDVTVNVSAHALVLNPKTGRHEGPGTIEVLGPPPTFPVLVRDLTAAVSVAFAPSGTPDGCPSVSVTSLHVDGVAEGPGNRFVFDASGAVMPEGGCARTKLIGQLEIAKGSGFIKKSWGSIKVGSK